MSSQKTPKPAPEIEAFHKLVRRCECAEKGDRKAAPTDGVVRHKKRYPTSLAAVASGELYSNAGVVTVKP